MKNRITKVLSVLLSLTLFFSAVNTSVSAQDVSISSNLSFFENISLEEYNRTEEAKKIYNSLSKEARQIFDVDLKILIFKEKYGITPRSAAAGLAALELPTPVLYSLQGMMAGFTAAAADGPLPFGDALLIATSVAAAATIAIYWYDIAPKWDQIIAVFKQELTGFADTIGRVFAKIKGDAKSKTPTGRKVREVKQRLRKEGFKKTRQEGSHERWVKGDKKVTVPNHGENSDIAPGTLRNIWKQAGWIK